MGIIVEQARPATGLEGMSSTGVVFPAYNEARNIAGVIERALEVGAGRIVGVNDRSQDETGAILERLARHERVEAVHHEVNMGKQAAAKNGLQRLLGHPEIEVVAILDADMQNDPALLPGLCGHVGPYDAVVGRRGRGEMPAARRAANALANAPYQVIAALAIHDIQSGYRLYTRQVAAYLARHLTLGGRYTLEHESVLLLGRLSIESGRDYRVAEVEIEYTYEGAESSIRLRDDLQLAWASLRYAVGLARMQRRRGS
ncbi:MAG: glycosyltransferase family 2 protein [Candidatus Brocadiaceae bacterium]|jgi:glycosyltransferase involved in cell wall biosynthesis